MAGAKFTYDESGNTFYYFATSFYLMILIPLTYYYRPKKEKKDSTQDDSNDCQCHGCIDKRAFLKKTSHKKSNRKIYIILVIAWIIAAIIVYKVSSMKNEAVAFDPYEILKISEGAMQAQIRAAYRTLSKIHHPDRGGDPKKFIMISRAYKALANEESRKMWEEFGDPDGPREIKFGIALPSWIVEKNNSWMIVAFYFIVFLGLPPVGLYFWWRRAVKYGGDKVYSDTVKLFTYQVHKTHTLATSRALMVLSAAFEFCGKMNPDIKERESDNEDLSKLVSKLGSEVKIGCKEQLLGAPYSVKTRALLLAHMQKMELPSKNLKNEGQVRNVFSSIENILKLSQCLIQCTWGDLHPMLQIPHLKREMLRHFQTKKRSIRTITDLVALPAEDRRSLLRTLTDQDYNDAMKFCANLPYLSITVDTKVVTRYQTIVLQELFHEANKEKSLSEEIENIGPDDENEKKDRNAPMQNHNSRKKQGKNKKSQKFQKGKKPAQKKITKKVEEISTVQDEESENDNADDEEENKSDAEYNSDDDDVVANGKDEWEVKMEKRHKEYLYGDTVPTSPLVHCPYFPEERRESWFVYLADKKHSQFLTERTFSFVDDLVDTKELTFQFPAPPNIGSYGFCVVVRSDCYLDVDKRVYHTINVEAPKESHIAEVSDLESETESESEDNGEDVTDSGSDDWDNEAEE
ncbi:uncharacterized protein TRIADDRAFT_56581 [Trichoplax adhaerens]|uniref:J domain-containing protein n=1 Tax=Trichoplax adhaerens TaxID=10228 RepID=B3RYJ6_TRIAD|nr:hypothetical protein TRIADDRAFT_56581 [Trichoplax adhaerens]EDV24609.1 hypothetical protein TRIADDRAFT_56581 [Trichoplax adhaerens]|eukprot:XP_002112499.1 hypothetical protein TRIADDRAFT_56581 [Trichoplax adhaerens]